MPSNPTSLACPDSPALPLGRYRIRADVLDRLLHERHLSQADLARETGVNRSTIHRLLNRGQNPSPATISAILAIFSGIDPTVLFEPLEPP